MQPKSSKVTSASSPSDFRTHPQTKQTWPLSMQIYSQAGSRSYNFRIREVSTCTTAIATLTGTLSMAMGSLTSETKALVVAFLSNRRKPLDQRSAFPIMILTCMHGPTSKMMSRWTFKSQTTTCKTAISTTWVPFRTRQTKSITTTRLGWTRTKDTTSTKRSSKMMN